MIHLKSTGQVLGKIHYQDTFLISLSGLCKEVLETIVGKRISILHSVHPRASTFSPGIHAAVAESCPLPRNEEFCSRKGRAQLSEGWKSGMQGIQQCSSVCVHLPSSNTLCPDPIGNSIRNCITFGQYRIGIVKILNITSWH